MAKPKQVDTPSFEFPQEGGSFRINPDGSIDRLNDSTGDYEPYQAASTAETVKE